jgi:hypothetical protein
VDQVHDSPDVRVHRPRLNHVVVAVHSVRLQEPGDPEIFNGGRFSVNR